MAKTILELFQTQNLANGKTAEETYAIRDIKKELKNESKNNLENFIIKNNFENKIKIFGHIDQKKLIKSFKEPT